MVIAFNSKGYGKIHLVGRPQTRECALEPERGKVICIAPGCKIKPLDEPRRESAGEPEYVPPMGA